MSSNNNNSHQQQSNGQQPSSSSSANPDHRLLGTTIIHASSEDESFPATELNQAAGNAPMMAPRGWQSAKLGDFPQEIGLRFESGASFVSQIQILAHQSKTPTRVDIFVYPPPPAKMSAAQQQQMGDVTDPVAEMIATGGLSANIPSYHDAPFHRLGYVTFRNNEVTKYRTRERKSVQLNVKAIYVRLVLHKCYSNPVNLYSQVGVVALTAWGKPLITNQNSLTMTPPSKNSLKQQQSNNNPNNNNDSTTNNQPPPLSSTRKGPSGTDTSRTNNNNNQNHSIVVSANQALQSAAASLEHSRHAPLNPVVPPPHHSRTMTRFSTWYSDAYNSLAEIKSQAVDSEDFELAKNVKERMTWLAAQAAEVNLMDSQKCALADNEDYQSAQQLHMRQSQKIDLVMKLSTAAAPSDSVTAIVAQMNHEMLSSSPNNSPPRSHMIGTPNNNNRPAPKTKKQKLLEQHLNQGGGAAMSSSPAGGNLQDISNINNYQQQQGGFNSPQSQHHDAFLTSPQSSHQQQQDQQQQMVNNTNNSRIDENQIPASVAVRKANSPNNNNNTNIHNTDARQQSISTEEQKSLLNNLMTSPAGAQNTSSGNLHNESQQQQLLNAEDQPIRSKFAIEMAKARIGGGSPDKTEAGGAGSSSGGAASAAKKKPSKKKTPAVKRPKKNPDDSEDDEEESDEDEDEDEKEIDSSSSDDEDVDPKNNKKPDIFGEDKKTANNDNQNNSNIAPEDEDPQNSLPVAVQVEGWEREVMKLVEETAAARFVATGDPEQQQAQAQQQQQAPSSAMEQQQRAENAGAASAGLHFVLGKYVGGCLFSRRWVMRESALCTAMNHLEIFAKHTKSATDVVEALLVYLDTKGYGLLDHVPSIFGVCRDFLMKVVGTDDESYSSVNMGHIAPKITNLLPRLLLKACEGAGKVREDSSALILALSKNSAIGPHSILPFLTCKPLDADKRAVKTVTQRHYQVRLSLLQLLYSFEYEDAHEACSQAPNLRALESIVDGAPLYPTSTSAFDALVGKFLIPCVNHASSEVRDPAASILVHIMLHYLNEANTNNNAAMRQKVLGTLRKLENPVSKNLIISLVAPPKPQTQTNNDGSNTHTGDASLTPTNAAGDDHSHLHPPQTRRRQTPTDLQNNNNNDHYVAKTAHPGAHHHVSKPPIGAVRSGGGGVARVVSNHNINRGGRSSVTPQPGGTPSHLNNNNRGTPTTAHVGGTDRKSITPKAGGAIFRNNNTGGGGVSPTPNIRTNTNNNPLPTLAGGNRGMPAGVVGVSPTRNLRNPLSPGSHLSPAAPVTNRNSRKQPVSTAVGSNLNNKGRRVVGSVAAAKNHTSGHHINNNNNNNNNNSNQSQQPQHGAQALGSIVGHSMA